MHIGQRKKGKITSFTDLFRADKQLYSQFGASVRERKHSDFSVSDSLLL